MAIELVDLPVLAEERSFNWNVARPNLTTQANVQYAVWWNPDRNPIIGKRTIGETSWETFDLSTVTGNPLNAPVPNDGHNTLSVAVDVDGLIHVAGNMHAEEMRYVRSTAANDITAWTDADPPGGAFTDISYVAFVRLSGGELLTFWRDGESSLSDHYQQSWDGTSWSSPTQIIEGAANGEGVYLQNIGVGNDDSIHVGVIWRDSTSDLGVYNDVSHMVSRDAGATWEAMDGTSLSLPATHSSMPLAFDTPDDDNGLLNASGLTVDNDGNPHIACHVFSDDGTASRILHTYWQDGSWFNAKLFQEWTGKRVVGEGSADSVARPAIFATNSNRVFVIYRNDLEWPGEQVRIREVTPGGGTGDAKLADVPDSFDPSFDTRAVRGENLLAILIPDETLLTLDLATIDGLFEDEDEDGGGDGEPGDGGMAQVAQAQIRTRLTWLSCNLSDGAVITELPDLQGDEVSRVIGEYTSASLSLPIPIVGGRDRDITLAQRAQLAIQSTQPPRTKIVAVVNDVPAWEGIPLPRDLGTDAEIPLGCVSMEGYLRHVYIGDHSYDEQDVALIADGILRDAVTTPHGPGIALLIDAPNIGTIASRSYLDIDNQTVYAGLQELMKAGLMEWTLSPDWRMGFPYRIVDTIARVRGQLGSGGDPTAVFQSATFSSQGASDARYQLNEDYGDDRYANVVRMHGAGEGDDQLRSAPAIDQAQIDSGVPVWELRESAPRNVEQQALLDLHAERRLGRVRGGAHTLEITARWDAPGARLGVDWQIGDLVRHELRGHAHPDGLNGVKRAIGFALSIQRGTIRPILQDEEA